MECAQNSNFGTIWSLTLIKEDTTIIFEIN